MRGKRHSGYIEREVWGSGCRGVTHRGGVTMWKIIRRNVNGCTVWESKKDGHAIYAATTNWVDGTPVEPSGCQYFHSLKLALRSIWMCRNILRRKAMKDTPILPGAKFHVSKKGRSWNVMITRDEQEQVFCSCPSPART